MSMGRLMESIIYVFSFKSICKNNPKPFMALLNPLLIGNSNSQKHLGDELSDNRYGIILYGPC